jgi:hypothetical protein
MTRALLVSVLASSSQVVLPGDFRIFLLQPNVLRLVCFFLRMVVIRQLRKDGMCSPSDEVVDGDGAELESAQPAVLMNAD